MKSHRAIWLMAIASLVVAGTVASMRKLSPAAHDTEMEAHRDALIAEMLERLEMDHRVRRPETRVVVEHVAAFTDPASLATAETYYALGLKKYYGESRMNEAEAAFVQASRMRPEWAWPHNALGIVRFVAGNREEALASFARARELDPSWSRPHVDMAILHLREGEMEEAFLQAKQALSIEPNHPVNHYNFAVLLDSRGDHLAARARYEKVLEMAPDLAPALYNMACSYAREGDSGRALPYLREAIVRIDTFRQEALDDSDFDPIRDDPGFLTIVHPTDNSPEPEKSQ